ncbi:MAG: FAD-binding oxidoreductase, partial [Gammaproteobacteria bacterium]|nr:FAD-binding oxidoreductase [Gammaproteobacteria bacterium]
SAALHLAREGADVVLLEATHIGYGGSGRNVGLVNAGLWLPPDDIESRLGVDKGSALVDALAGSPELVFSLIEQFDIQCEATRNGTLHLAHSASGFKDLQVRHQQQIKRNAPVELLDEAQTRKRLGSAAFKGALLDHRAGTIQPFAYAQGLADAASRVGAKLFERSAVSSLGYDGCWQVSGQGFEVQAPKLIQATNAYSTDARAFATLHYSQWATAPLKDLPEILPNAEGCWDTATVMTSIRKDRENRLIIGAMGNVAGPVGGIHARWARRKLKALFPELSRVAFEYEWSGKIAMSADYLPKVFALGEGAISIQGYSGRGIGPGTWFGSVAAKWARTGDDSVFPCGVESVRTQSLRTIKSGVIEMGALASHLVG